MPTPKTILEAHAAACRDALSNGKPRPPCPPEAYGGVDLSDADLSDADLSRADLYCAVLRDAKLYCAKLYGADLVGADLTGANLTGTDLSGADLSGADLSGAVLYGAVLYGAVLRDTTGISDVPRAPVPGLAAAILRQITEHPETWVQEEWHCDTGHCCAGWAVMLAGEAGKAAEKRLGTPEAARLLLGGDGHPFGGSDAELVIPWLRERIREASP